MIAIIDYDAGNLKSVEKALLTLGHESVSTRDFKIILNADKVVLPGVGAFSDAMQNLKKYYPFFVYFHNRTCVYSKNIVK